MALSDEDKRAAEFVELAGPVLQALGASAGIDEMHDVGSMLAKMPWGEVIAFFGRMRKDLINIDAGTMTVGVGVEVVADDG